MSIYTFSSSPHSPSFFSASFLPFPFLKSSLPACASLCLVAALLRYVTLWHSVSLQCRRSPGSNSDYFQTREKRILISIIYLKFCKLTFMITAVDHFNSLFLSQHYALKVQGLSFVQMEFSITEVSPV